MCLASYLFHRIVSEDPIVNSPSTHSRTKLKLIELRIFPRRFHSCLVWTRPKAQFPHVIGLSDQSSFLAQSRRRERRKLEKKRRKNNRTETLSFAPVRGSTVHNASWSSTGSKVIRRVRMHPAARATPGNVTFDTFRKMIASDEDRWIHRATKVSSRYDDRERRRKKNGEERRDLSWDDDGATTLIASSRSMDQTDRELKRSLALLRLALWPRRNTATLG